MPPPDASDRPDPPGPPAGEHPSPEPPRAASGPPGTAPPGTTESTAHYVPLSESAPEAPAAPDSLLGSNFAPTLTVTSPPAPGSDPARTVTLRSRLDELIDRTLIDAVPLADGYKLVSKIGAGTFGTVWQAEDLQTGEHVAIKFFATGDAQWEKMLEEVKVLQAVEGSHGIVMVKQVRRGEFGRPPYYVMQFARGGSLADLLDRHKA